MFKVGDIVICINNLSRENVLTVGDEYEVLLVSDKLIRIENNLGNTFSYYASRFKLKKEIIIKEVW